MIDYTTQRNRSYSEDDCARSYRNRIVSLNFCHKVTLAHLNVLYDNGVIDWGFTTLSIVWCLPTIYKVNTFFAFRQSSPLSKHKNYKRHEFKLIKFGLWYLFELCFLAEVCLLHTYPLHMPYLVYSFEIN